MMTPVMTWRYIISMVACPKNPNTLRITLMRLSNLLKNAMIIVHDKGVKITVPKK